MQYFPRSLPKIQILGRTIPYRRSSRHFRQRTTRPPISTQQIFAYNVQIGSLVRARKFEAARQLFDEMPQRDIVTWNTIIAAYWKNGNIEESRRIFDLMPKRNVVSWNSMITGCAENERIDEAIEYFQRMPMRNTASWNAMISGFVKCNRIEEAVELFEEMPRRNVISYTVMVDGYARMGEIEKARDLFDRIARKNSVSWAVMISGYVENGRFEEARLLFDEMSEKNIVAFTAMITGYCREGKMENARNLFDEIELRDLVSWNAMISGYAQNGQGKEAVELHSQMQKTGMKPDHSTLVVVLIACSVLVSLQQGRQTHVIIIKNGFETNTSVCNSLITMYSKCGSIRESEIVFGKIRCPDLVSYNTIIAGYAQHGQYEKALGLFDEMGKIGLKPDGLTFLSILSACGHAGKVNESVDWFDSMVKDYGIAPRAEHYSCLVDILSRARQLNKAYELIKEMPFEADGAVWGALLGACRVHLNVELGVLAAKKLIELEPQNSGPYIMLSNIYAAAGMWKEVTMVRRLMKEQGVKKQPGYSWMEIGDKLHIFLGGDISHPEIDKIHLELKRIGLQMKMSSDDMETSLV